MCGRLDVGDRLALIRTGRLPSALVANAIRAAVANPAFDGPETSPSEDGVVFGTRTVVKVQQCLHERLETLRNFEELRTATGVRGPRLLDSGTEEGAWWVVLERLPGVHGDRPTPGRQRELGHQLRRWHSRPPRGGLRLDAPGALGVLLGSARATIPDTYGTFAELVGAVCAGSPMTAIHGDAAVGHNVLFDGDVLTGLLDPGATESGPPMLDLAWALAVDMPRGAGQEPLIEGYGADGVDRRALAALLPLMMLRRLIDASTLGLDADAAWIAAWLDARRPDLLVLAG